MYEPSPRALALSAASRAFPEDSADAQSLRLASAAIDYYPREAKSYWGTHFLRLREPVAIWEEVRDVVVLDGARCRVVEDWHRPEGARADRRVLELRGELAPGTRLSEGTDPFALYELPAPFPFEPSPRWIHADHRVQVVEVLDDGAIVEEFAVQGETWSQLPIALTPPPPPRAGNQQSAIDAWADTLIAAAPAFPEDPATDILRRRPPRTLRRLRDRRHAAAPSSGNDVDAIVRSLLDLDRSYLAVQGPPGTGKTYVGSHVIARLIREHGYKIGVVAQSHAVVENMLDRIVDAGVSPAQVAKAPKDASAAASFTVIPKNGMAAYVAEQTGGFVVGGTAWDFSHEGRIPRGSLDLLVIDEAGQFSLASTIAVSLAAPRLLLLGDPQQLPQVSQGTHPEPVDTSALGWVMDGSDVVPPEFGYFLARTWRMHPAVAEPVSRLSYRGELASHPSAGLRTLEGIEPGLVAVPVRHHGNSTQSLEEAEAVVAIVRGLLGRAVDRDHGERRGDHRARAASPRAVRHHHRHALQRAAGGDRGVPRGGRVRPRAGRHGRQVPGQGGGRRDPVARGVVGPRCAARSRVPAPAQSPQCRDLAGHAHRVRRAFAWTPRRPAAHAGRRRTAERIRPARPRLTPSSAAEVSQAPQRTLSWGKGSQR